MSRCGKLLWWFLGAWLIAVGCGVATPTPRILDNRLASPVPFLGPSREVVVWVDPSFTSDNQASLASAHSTREILEHLGVRVVYVLYGEPSDGSSTINQRISSSQPHRIIYVYNWLNLDSNSGTVGVYPYRTDRIYIDETRCGSPREFRTVFLHEFGHWAGLSHICLTEQQKNEPRNRCDLRMPVGPAIMNPIVSNNTPEVFTPLDDLARSAAYSL